MFEFFRYKRRMKKDRKRYKKVSKEVVSIDIEDMSLFSLKLPVKLNIYDDLEKLTAFEKELERPDNLLMRNNLEDATCAAVTRTYGDIIIYMPKEADLSTVVHESVHVKQIILGYLGEDYPSNEFEAYLVQRIFEWIQEKRSKCG
jgi:hypothetical protein